MGLSILFPAESFPFPEFPHDYIILCMIREEHTGLERKKRDALCDTNSKVRLNYSGLITSLKRPRQAEDYVAGQHTNEEIDEYAWFSPEEACRNIKPGSLAEQFLHSWLNRDGQDSGGCHAEE